jgi:hypothetical protein
LPPTTADWATASAASGYTGRQEQLKRSCLRGAGQVVLTINVAVLLAVVIILRLRRRTEARSRNDEKLTVLIVLVFGVLIAPTAFGQGILNVVGQLAGGITDSASP